MTTSYEEFITTVVDEAGVHYDDAERATSATLQTLAERISGGEARDIAEQLPRRLRPLLSDGDLAEGFGVHEFLRRVGEREGVREPTAEEHARAVLIAVGRSVDGREFEDMAAQLPKEFEPLLPHKMPADEFLELVARAAGISVDQARRTTDAVLETLAERIGSGQVDDLEDWVPRELHPALERGRQSEGPNAHAMPTEEFMRRVARRAGIVPYEALIHCRAVFGTLHEGSSPKEFSDVIAQLRKEDIEAFAPFSTEDAASPHHAR
jgi:uncharacterized protein (DUF2267 family)